MVFTTEEVQTKALNEVNLEIKQGEFVAIMGPSGCGKSTLLNILGTLDSPTSGKYFFKGKEVDKMGESQLTAFRKGNIGFVFQSFNLIDELTVFENVELPLVYLGGRKSERRRKVMEVLDRMNIAHRAGHFPQHHVMPGVLIIEALVQVGAVAILSLPENRGKIAFFGGIKNARFKRQVVPGDVLELSCELVERRGSVGFGKAVAKVDGKVAAQGELTFAIG